MGFFNSARAAFFSEVEDFSKSSRAHEVFFNQA